MILRRVIEHLKHQQWTAIGIELLIVVLGVFIGLQASSWDQARRDREAGRAILENLAAEYAGLEREAEALSTDLGSRHAVIEELLALLRAPDLPLDAAELARRFESVLDLPLAVGESATQQEITSSGQWHVIADRELRSLLIAQSERTRSAQAGQQARREFARPYVVSIVRLQALLDERYPPEKAITLAGGRDELRIALRLVDGIYQGEQSSAETTLAGLKAVRARLNPARQTVSE